ncbi:MAG: class I SAM-dependent methyltransferase [Verrucomicrobia bacterium]|nr:class I SAM-dependent methyltransferase [Verrucomicrobiota bacterium]
MRSVCYTANTIRYRVEWPRIAEAWAKIGQADTIFDGGAGSGEFARRALQGGLCRHVIALEYDAKNFIQLERNLGRDQRAKLLRGSVLEIPLANQSVDLVMSTQVIEHIQDHEKVAAEFNRILRPGGYAIITTPHPPEPFPNNDHVREGYTADDLRALFAPHGWEPLWSDYFLTRETTQAMMRADKLPARGVYLPVAWVDQETGLDGAARKSRSPYGILMLFRKPA